MNDVIIGKGNLAGVGVYANRDFKQGEIVILYHLQSLTEDQYQNLSDQEKMFTHIVHGQIYLYLAPERYVNHSATPNTYQDHTLHADIAIRDICRGEMITTDATKDDAK